jgi:hypothetical protein
MTHSLSDFDKNVSILNDNESNSTGTQKSTNSNDFKKPKRLVIRNKTLENFNLASPTLNKRYRYSVLPTVNFKYTHLKHI